MTVLADTDDELSETFTVTLAYGASASHLTGSSAVANVTLTDSNQAEVTLEWNETAVMAAEPDTAGGTRTVTLTAVATTMGENAPDPGFDLGLHRGHGRRHGNAARRLHGPLNQRLLR